VGQQTAKRQKVHETITVLVVTLPNVHRFKKNLTHRLGNKPFLIWLLTTPPHFKYVATIPCNLLLMACFADDSVSQGSVATYGCLQCFDAVGWAAGRASGLQKTEWWGAGVVICLERGTHLHMVRWCHCHSLTGGSLR